MNKAERTFFAKNRRPPPLDGVLRVAAHRAAAPRPTFRSTNPGPPPRSCQVDEEAERHPPSCAEHIEFDTHGLRLVRLASLSPNPVNTEVFAASLGEDSIRDLADDIRRRKLQNPIHVTPELVVLDGERRRRALLTLGIAETHVQIVEGVDTTERVEDYVLDSFASTRDASFDERIRLFSLALDVLQRRHGRPQSRPSKKSSSNDDHFWDPDRIRQQAAKKAGFGSVSIAERATRVFKCADEELLAKVIAGEVSISAADATLAERDPKRRANKKKTKSTKTEGKKPPKANPSRAKSEDPHPSEPSLHEALELRVIEQMARKDKKPVWIRSGDPETDRDHLLASVEDMLEGLHGNEEDEDDTVKWAFDLIRRVRAQLAEAGHDVSEREYQYDGDDEY